MQKLLEDLDLLAPLTRTGMVNVEDGYHLAYVDSSLVEIPLSLLGKGAPGAVHQRYPAHISVIYPNELCNVLDLDRKELSREFEFIITGIGELVVGNKVYLAIIADAPDLEAYREAYGLSRTPNFKSINVPFHITFASSPAL